MCACTHPDWALKVDMEVWSHQKKEKKDMNIGLASSENAYKVLQSCLARQELFSISNPKRLIRKEKNSSMDLYSV